MKLTAYKSYKKTKKLGRKTYRKEVINHYHNIQEQIKLCCKNGRFSWMDINMDPMNQCLIHAYRLFQYKHKDFHVTWKYRNKVLSCIQENQNLPFTRHIEKIYHVQIRWDLKEYQELGRI